MGVPQGHRQERNLSGQMKDGYCCSRRRLPNLYKNCAVFAGNRYLQGEGVLLGSLCHGATMTTTALPIFLERWRGDRSLLPIVFRDSGRIRLLSVIAGIDIP